MLQKWWNINVWHYSIAAEVYWDECVIVGCNVQSAGLWFWMPLLEVISGLQKGDEIKGLKTNIVYWWFMKEMQNGGTAGNRWLGLEAGVFVSWYVWSDWVLYWQVFVALRFTVMFSGSFQVLHVTSASSESGCYSSVLQ